MINIMIGCGCVIIMDHVPIIVQTNYGNVDINNINIGDMVYDYKTSELHEVKNIINSHMDYIYKITYTDERIAYYLSSERIYINNEIITINEIIRRKSNMLILHPQSIGYLPTHIRLTPDPYIAGALLLYGDYNDEYISIPMVRNVIDHISYQYHIYPVEHKNDKVYFRSMKNIYNEMVTWKDIFPNHSMGDIKKTIIPMNYRRASLNDRWKFIRGVFDTGYHNKKLPYTCSIINKYRERLEVVQSVLWSLGVTSFISLEGTNYILDISEDSFNVANLFYNIDRIEKKNIHDVHRWIHGDPFTISIETVFNDGSGCSRNLQFDKPNIIYLTHNFLPRVSI